jgi:Arc/MetJ-type ribon-helix-helix transcriptional regulator
MGRDGIQVRYTARYTPRAMPDGDKKGSVDPGGLVSPRSMEYCRSMRSNTKSSITLPTDELKLVQKLKTRLRLKSNVEVVRTGLRLLKERTDREELKESYRQASRATRRTNAADAKELDDALVAEGLD